MSAIFLRILLPFLILGVLCGDASAGGKGAASDRVYDSDGKHWTILRQPERKSCSMAVGFVEDALVYLGEEDEQEDIKFYFIFLEKGLPLSTSRNYDVEMKFIGGSSWRESGEGARYDTYGGVHLRNLDSDFAVDFAREGALSIMIEGKDYGIYDLAGSKRGVLQLIKCRQELIDGKVPSR